MAVSYIVIIIVSVMIAYLILAFHSWRRGTAIGIMIISMESYHLTDSTTNSYLMTHYYCYCYFQVQWALFDDALGAYLFPWSSSELTILASAHSSYCYDSYSQ